MKQKNRHYDYISKINYRKIVVEKYKIFIKNSGFYA